MYPILFKIGDFTVYTHGFFVLVGVLAGAWIIYYLAKSGNLHLKNFLDFILYIVIAGLVGARLFYVVIYHDQFNNFWQYFAVWHGGLISWGGIIFGFAAAFILLKKENQSYLAWFDIGIIGLMLGWVFGRIGCFFSGDVVGKVSDSWYALSFPVLGFAKRHPIAIYESIWAAVIFFILIMIYTRKKLKDGAIFFIGIGMYSLGRFFIDFYRIENGLLWGLTFGQYVDLAVFLSSLTLLILKFRRFNGTKIIDTSKIRVTQEKD